MAHFMLRTHPTALQVIHCDLSILEWGNRLVHHTFHCVLPLNAMNEKVGVAVSFNLFRVISPCHFQLFTFLWFWLAILLVVNVLNLMQWTYLFFVDSSAVTFIRDQLVRA